MVSMKPKLQCVLLFLITLKRGESSKCSSFPPNFKFGVATSSYQIEGGWNADNKSENIWDHICHTNPSFIENEENGDVACDSYHKYKDDINMLKDLNVDFYRFSLSWSRIVPGGFANSSVNKKGVQYYKNLIRGLLDNNIQPFVTIYHWDLPQVLEDIDGWPNPQLVEHFVYYAKVVFEEFGDYVKYWSTFNEPKQVCLGGYGYGGFAPGKNSTSLPYDCAHTVIKAHAAVYRMYQKEFKKKQGGHISMVTDVSYLIPYRDSTSDKNAAYRGLQFSVGWFLNPIVYGNYPKVMIEEIAKESKKSGRKTSRLPSFTPKEMEFIKGTYDFIPINVYFGDYAAWPKQNNVTDGSSFFGIEDDMKAQIFSSDKWESGSNPTFKNVPWSMRKAVDWIKRSYKNPEIYITENGFPAETGLDDPRRTNYIKQYLQSLLDAICEDGANVTRYTVWALMDTFEWASGYEVKFGLYQVNFTNPERPRAIRSSGEFYSKVAKEKRLY